MEHMSFPKCLKCKVGDLVPLSDFGSQGAAIHYKAWVCTSPDCGFNLKIRNGDIYVGIGLVKIFSQLGFYTKVCERITYNFQFPNRILASLVKADMHFYLEIEKMSDKKNEKKDKKELVEISKILNVELVKTKKAYYDYCNMLTKIVDWEFHGTKNDFKKLEKVLKKKYAQEL